MTPQLSIVPKVSLGDFHLGSTLNTVLKQARTVNHRLVYSGKQILTTPFLLQLPQFGIQLLFNQTTQRLIVIELVQLSKLELTYKGKTIRDWDIKKVYNDVFGPTYQGVIVNNNYILSYPGISFKFALSESEINGKIPKEKILGKLLDRNAKVLAIVIHPYKEYSEWNSTTSCSFLTRKTEVEKLVVYPTVKSIIIHFLRHPQNLKTFEILLNESNQQDILCTLGPPDDTFLKVDNRTQIHSPSNSLNPNEDEDDDEGLTFHNYFRYGFDLLYKNNILNKLIIHNNTPLNKLLFGKYEKCAFEIPMEDEESSESSESSNDMVTGDTPFSKIQKLMESEMELIILNRSNKSIGKDIEIIDAYEVDDDDGSNGNGYSEGKLELNSLCYVDHTYGLNWDVIGGQNIDDDVDENGTLDGVVNSLTIY